MSNAPVLVEVEATRRVITGSEMFTTAHYQHFTLDARHDNGRQEKSISLTLRTSCPIPVKIHHVNTFYAVKASKPNGLDIQA